MQTVSEEICGEYLKNILKCDFVTYNIVNPDIQGEIDVIGIDLLNKRVYVCEVAAHTQGLQYVKNNKPDDYNRFYSKFKKDIEYTKKYLKEYASIHPMLWSPIVKISGPNAKYNTFEELGRLKADVDKQFDVNLELIINEEFESALEKLKNFALRETAHFSSPVMRTFQIEQNLEKHLSNHRKRGLINKKH